MDYVILRTDSQKDGESFSIVTRKKAENIIQNAGSATAEILATVNTDIRSIVKEQISPGKPPVQFAIDIINNEFSLAIIELRNAADMPEFKKKLNRCIDLRNILELMVKLPKQE